jgi:DNA-directed RNA polymerase specialized sigma24 family protein
MGFARHDVAADPAEAVAQIADARRDWMLRVNRRRLRWEDLEDCYSQATLELVARSRRSPFASMDHVENALEQKFSSRIEDRRRAIGGRSSIETAMARAVSVDSPEHGAGDLEDRRAAVEQQAIARTELRRLREVIADLSRDQQLVLVSQVCVDMGTSEFCSRYGWSVEKYRKVAQRARAKLRVLVEEYERGDRCRRLEPDILALSARVAEGQALTRAKAHLTNCQSCARMAGDIDRGARSIAAVLPLPAALAGGAWLRLHTIWSELRRLLAIARHPLAETSYGGVGAAGGSVAGLGALKVGIAVVCVAGAAGGYAVCSHLGVVPLFGFAAHPRHLAASHETASTHQDHARATSRRVLRPPARPSPTPTPTLDTPASQKLQPRPRPTTAVEQIRREFGAPRARIASSTRTVTTTPTIRAQVPNSTETAQPSTPQARQTQAEFGFER